MAVNNYGQRRRPMSDINVVPYIDVMLVLLVIFMITAPLLTQGVKVELPQAAADPISQDIKEPLIVSVDEHSKLYLSIGLEPKKPIDADTLVNQVAAVLRIDSQTPVLIRGSKSVEYGKVVSVMALLQQTGVTGVGLLTEPIRQQK